jgi:hypothetical protein
MGWLLPVTAKVHVAPELGLSRCNQMKADEGGTRLKSKFTTLGII